MDLPDLKKLNKIIALCRKQGVKIIKIGNVELTLSEDGPAPSSRSRKAKETKAFVYDNAPIESDEISSEAMLMWSAVDPTQDESQSE